MKLQNKTIIPWKTEAKTFQESLRGEVFNQFRKFAQDGDWWCRLDADEFYVKSPREFLSEVSSTNHVVWGLAVESRILYKHYKYRSPEQIQKRLQTRQIAINQGFPGWEHAMETDWRKTIGNADELQYDNQNDELIMFTPK